ncbi:MAG: sulfatase [Planctomycetota bacterium]
MLTSKAVLIGFAGALFGALAEDPQKATPHYIRLFDLLAPPYVEGLPDAAATEDAASARIEELGFEADGGTKVWLGREVNGGLSYDAHPEHGLTLTSEGGLEGGALRLGPGLEDAGWCAVLLARLRPMHRYVLRGRVRLEGHPYPSEASAREVLRASEYPFRIADPSRAPRFFGFDTRPRRVARERDASGWDRFELSFVSGAQSVTLLIELLHQNGGLPEARTWYDHLVLEEHELTSQETAAAFAERYRPKDGNETTTPWRLRPTLLTPDELRQEERDAILVPPPGRLRFALRLPPAETQPQIRFFCGMLPEAHGAPGDGVIIQLSFEAAEGQRIVLGTLELDPKAKPQHRPWQKACFDLAKVAGREGALTIAVDDIPGSERDPLDAVVIATPRIEPASEGSSLFSVLLIGVDTLRADHLSAFGYERPTTPHLEQLVARSFCFTNARSQAPWTLPSFAAILTSLYPSAHGAGRGGHDEWTPIDPTTTSLAETLARHGYETQGISANFLVSPIYGLDQGFEAYRSPGGHGWSLESVAIDTVPVTRFIEEHRSTPFFLFWHVMDPHLPYDTPQEYRAAFTDPSYAGRFARGRPVVPFHDLDPRPGRRWFAHEGPPPPPKLSPEDRRHVRDYYDAEIAEVDAAVGRVLEALEQTGMSEHTIVALVGDHGEGLGDHDHYHHGYTLFEDQVHVPMIVCIPGREEGGVIESPVATIDLAPTILAALGLPIPESFQGVDRLASPAAGEPSTPLTPVFLEYATYDSSALKACVLGSFKYLHDPVFHVEELYDLAADPAERKNVIDDHPELAATTRALLDRFRWEELQKGRYHLRILGERGRRLRIAIETDDLFDANFVAEPGVPEEDCALDLDRRLLEITTVLASSRFELVFWCRGETLRFEIELDGEPLPKGLRYGGEDTARALPLSLGRATIPTLSSLVVGSPAQGGALLWLEAGARETTPVVPTPEEIERLRELGYVR